MAISDNYVPIRQLGNGVTTQFSANWAVLAAAYLTVLFEDATTGVQTPVSPSLYTLVFTNAGFTVTFITAPASTVYVIIGRDVTLDQTDPYSTSKGFQGVVLEASLDKLTAMIQDLGDGIGRSITFPLGDTATSVLPGASARAGQFLGFDASGNAIVGAAASAIVSLAMQPVVSATTLPLARTALGLGSLATQNATAAAITGGTIDGTTIGGTTPTAASVTQLNGGQLAGFRNRIINGAMQIWQRGTNYALTTAIAYGSVDRYAFKQNTTAAGAAQRSASAPTGFQYSLQVGRTAAATSTGEIDMYTALETADTIPLQGKQVTLSYYAKAGANYSSAASALALNVWTGTGIDQAVSSMAGSWTGSGTPLSVVETLTTSFQRFSHTFTLAAGVTQVGLTFDYVPVGTAGADDNFYITGIQLEPGPVATPFEDISFAAALARCQRYYWKSFLYNTAPVQNAGQNTGEISFTASIAAASTERSPSFFFPTTMRTTPSIILYNTNAANAQVRDSSAAADCSASTTLRISDGNFQLTCTGNVSTVIGSVLCVNATASAEL